MAEQDGQDKVDAVDEIERAVLEAAQQAERYEAGQAFHKSKRSERKSFGGLLSVYTVWISTCPFVFLHNEPLPSGIPLQPTHNCQLPCELGSQSVSQWPPVGFHTLSRTPKFVAASVEDCLFLFH